MSKHDKGARALALAQAKKQAAAEARRRVLPPKGIGPTEETVAKLQDDPVQVLLRAGDIGPAEEAAAYRIRDGHRLITIDCDLGVQNYGATGYSRREYNDAQVQAMCFVRDWRRDMIKPGKTMLLAAPVIDMICDTFGFELAAMKYRSTAEKMRKLLIAALERAARVPLLSYEEIRDADAKAA